MACGHPRAGAAAVKLVPIYLGATKRFPAVWSFDLLPHFSVHVYPDSGYVHFAWLLFALELQWEYPR